MRRLLLVCIGGALGSGARYGVAVGLDDPLRTLPVPTLTVNLAGSFLIAFVVSLAAEAGILSTEARVFLATGVMGGFTTYSSFNLETLRLLEAGAFGIAAAYVGLTLLGCLLAGVAGLVAARRLGRARPGTGASDP